MSTMSTIRAATAIFSLTNLDHSSCLGTIESRLKKLNGIRGANVDFVTNAIEVNYDPEQLTVTEIRDFLRGLTTKQEASNASTRDNTGSLE